MKKYIACVLICAFIFTACSRSLAVPEVSEESISSIQETESSIISDISEISIDRSESSFSEDTNSTEITELVYEEPEFYGLDDADLIPYVKDDLYASMSSQFPSEDYTIEMINAVYIPQEYIDELANNSKSNIYFGYTEDELIEKFEGQRFAFTMDENNETTVELINEYSKDNLDKILLNVGIGCGVILVCAVVTVVTYGSDVPAIACICAISTGATTKSVLRGFECGAIGGLLSGGFEYYQTGDWDLALENAALAASEGFKYGAIFGAIEGGISGGYDFVAGGGFEVAEAPTWRDSENYVLDMYGGEKQVSYLNGEIVKNNTLGATRPDIIVPLDGSGAVNAIEVKNYNLANPNNLNEMIYTLKNEVSSRVINLPAGSEQTIVLDVRGRGFDEPIIENAVTKVSEALIDIYPDIPIMIVA